jgi:hypothetical protein
MATDAVHPETIALPDGSRWTLTTFLVHSNDNGVPKLLTMLPSGTKLDISGGETFFTAYVPQHLTEKK